MVRLGQQGRFQHRLGIDETSLPIQAVTEITADFRVVPLRLNGFLKPFIGRFELRLLISDDSEAVEGVGPRFVSFDHFEIQHRGLSKFAIRFQHTSLSVLNIRLLFWCHFRGRRFPERSVFGTSVPFEQLIGPKKEALSGAWLRCGRTT